MVIVEDQVLTFKITLDKLHWRDISVLMIKLFLSHDLLQASILLCERNDGDNTSLS